MVLKSHTKTPVLTVQLKQFFLFVCFSIDTPGVISRVSTLFRGHNNLIQGFNTFLPPGYRIECSMDPSDPNPIRVTTPRGTTSRPDGEPYEPHWQQQQQQPSQSHLQRPPQHGEQYRGYGMENHEAMNANPMSDPSGNNRAALQQQADARRPGAPVEFDYAISYVNKIKTRFADRPEIYNTFLEILQTYHRDQLRINEVYSQVTQLFADAPDLLDNFKQFLPDMSQQQSQQPPQMNQPQSQQMDPMNQHLPPPPQQQQQQIMSDNVRLPPVGNFSPPVTTSGVQSPSSVAMGNASIHTGAMTAPPAQSTPNRGDRKKRQNATSSAADYQGQLQTYDINQPVPISNTRGSGSKRFKNKDAPPSPTLVPAGPEPIGTNDLKANQGALIEEIAFFDKAKRFISNKQTYNEFLKVLNLFSQRIIDKNILVDRVEGFLGGNRELMNWFKNFVQYEGKPLHIENIPYKKHMLELSLCRTYGRSYRLLPKSEPYMPCSGRDEMCWEVLNDEWVGHPVWASEEAGFVAHRKNQYEEIMHRVEEERHEYDYYIEANLRSIQTLETLASRIANMSQEEKINFKLPPNLGHTSTIYEKVLKRIYGVNRYHEVVDALRESPAVAVPIVLKRMKQKDEEWKRAHREWNKVWRDTEQKVFYKSLDHRGLTFKQTDKKYLTSRQLISEISASTKPDQSNKRISPLQQKPKEQLLYQVKDYDVLMDLLRIVMCFLSHSNSYSSNDRERMEIFFKSFLKEYFSLPEDMITFPSKDEDSDSVEAATNNEDGVTTNKKRSLDTGAELLRDILKKSKQAKKFRGEQTEGGDEEDVEEEEEDPIERAGELWLKHLNSSVNLFEESHRDTYNMFANNTVYVFMRLILILYERLEEVKGYEAVVSDEIAHSRDAQFAIDLDLYDRRMDEMGLSFNSKNCYGQLLALIERLIEGDLEHQWYEEAIRQAYRNRAYKLYTVDKVAQAIVKHIHTIISDARSSDVLVMWEHDRTNPVTSTKAQILYRMRVKTVLGPDENMFRIEWNNKERTVMMQFLGSEDVTLKQRRTKEEEWNYYLTSYLMAGPTEGVPSDKVHVPFLQRTLVEEFTANEDDEDSSNKEANDFIDIVDQGLSARISLSSYKLFFEPKTSDYFTRKVGVSTNSSSELAIQQQTNKWRYFLNGRNGWAKGMTSEEADQAISLYNAMKTDTIDENSEKTSLIANKPTDDAEGVTSGSASSTKVATDEASLLAVPKDNDLTMSDVSVASVNTVEQGDITKSEADVSLADVSVGPNHNIEQNDTTVSSTTTLTNDVPVPVKLPESVTSNPAKSTETPVEHSFKKPSETTEKAPTLTKTDNDAFNKPTGGSSTSGNNSSSNISKVRAPALPEKPKAEDYSLKPTSPLPKIPGGDGKIGEITEQESKKETRDEEPSKSTADTTTSSDDLENKNEKNTLKDSKKDDDGDVQMDG